MLVDYPATPDLTTGCTWTVAAKALHDGGGSAGRLVTSGADELFTCRCNQSEIGECFATISKLERKTKVLIY
jgi:hypothetical protein